VLALVVASIACSGERRALPAIPSSGATLTLADRAAWRSAIGWPDDCERAFEATRATEDAGLEFFRLADDATVVQILCAQGAYQPTQVFGRIDDSDADRTSSLLSFDRAESADGVTIQTQRSDELNGEVSVSPTTMELTVVESWTSRDRHETAASGASTSSTRPEPSL
jgi:hypothetical protein